MKMEIGKSQKLLGYLASELAMGGKRKRGTEEKKAKKEGKGKRRIIRDNCSYTDFTLIHI